MFERPDPRLAQSADPSPIAALVRTIGRHAVALALCFVAVVAAYAWNVGSALHQAGSASGIVRLRGPSDNVTIVRDERDVPHVSARTDADAFFGEGYAQGTDRLFQLDLTRRYAYGTLSQIVGAKALSMDIAQRAVDIAGIADRQWRSAPPSVRAALVAFSAGINAAAQHQPLPVEFRLLLYRPAPWTPQDSLAVSVVASLELSDSWNDVVARDDVWRQEGARCFDALVPLSDPAYDVTVRGTIRTRSAAVEPAGCGPATIANLPHRTAIGSNAWAAGGWRTVRGSALIANDPHLDVTIPGIWYVVDVRSPHLHVAGATIPGVPGVVLGHNERLAWASTNAQVATTQVFRFERALPDGHWSAQRFAVRFASDRIVRYYRTPREFSVPAQAGGAALLVRWPIYSQRRSAIETILALDGARDARDASLALSRYRGSPQNFVLADCNGQVAYHAAGVIPDDPAWGRYVHPQADVSRTYPGLPYDSLPSAAPSRSGILLSANNRSYDAGYRYRLSAQFEPPYRAFRIAQLLAASRRYDAGYFAGMQLDTYSPIDSEISREVLRVSQVAPIGTSQRAAFEVLRGWDGRFDPDSQGAALEHSIRVWLLGGGIPLGPRLEQLRAGGTESAPGFAEDVSASLVSLGLSHRPWGDAGAIRIQHPLSPMHFSFLDGDLLPGAGNEDTIRLQEPGFAQGFRAVWDTGDWNLGGISIPSGESGEPGSPHYTDLTPAWIAGTLQPLPFGDSAVRRHAVGVLQLIPER
ncbi:MAG TPA: penicillin acylase family protein [Candidatus Tumulicola sp.]